MMRHSDNGNYGSKKNAKKRLRWGLVESAFGDSLDTGCRFCVGELGRTMASVAMKMLSYFIHFINFL